MPPPLDLALLKHELAVTERLVRVRVRARVRVKVRVRAKGQG